MTFADIIGNKDVTTALAGMIQSGKIPHAVMFHEDDGGDAFRIAIAFLDSLYKGNPRISKLIHPDLHFIFPTAAGSVSEQYLEKFRVLALSNPSFTESELASAMGIEGKNSLIAVSEAKHLLDVLSLSALEGGYRSVIFFYPEKMNQEAANRLLKLIEEPPQQTQFVFITHAPEKVLLTISSRCQRIRVASSHAAEIPEPEDGAELLGRLMSALISRNLYAALETGEAIAALPSRESVKLFCKFASDRMRRVFLVQQGLPGLSPEDAQTREWAGKCRKSFPRVAVDAFSRAVGLIDRNVNIKIVFTDLVNRLYTNL